LRKTGAQADLDFRGDSLEVLSGFPLAVKETFGFNLRRLQNGDPVVCAVRPMQLVGNGTSSEEISVARLKGDIFDNLGIPHSQASELRMRADILDAILRIIEREQLSQRELAVILDDHQPNMSDLMRGKIAKFSIEKLVRYADRLGIETRVTTVEKKGRQLAWAR
jgi:predicted XRE-type DNA-binding protein